jgi:hypothetical protein
MIILIDNIPRAGRLQQLVDSIANIQTDIEDYAAKMDKKNKAIRPLLKKILEAQGIPDIDKLIERAGNQLTTDQQSAFQKVCHIVLKGR